MTIGTVTTVLDPTQHSTPEVPRCLPPIFSEACREEAALPTRASVDLVVRIRVGARLVVEHHIGEATLPLLGERIAELAARASRRVAEAAA